MNKHLTHLAAFPLKKLKNRSKIDYFHLIIGSFRLSDFVCI